MIRKRQEGMKNLNYQLREADNLKNTLHYKN